VQCDLIVKLSYALNLFEVSCTLYCTLYASFLLFVISRSSIKYQVSMHRIDSCWPKIKTKLKLINKTHVDVDYDFPRLAVSVLNDVIYPLHYTKFRTFYNVIYTHTTVAS
jgi:hypothetical protein